MNIHAKNFKIIFFLLVLFLFLIQPSAAFAANLSCDNRYVTLVNPVRSRSLWVDQSLKPIQDQYSVINSHNFAATWLLQYDVFEDKELLSTIQNFNPNQEKGVFLEISPDLAKNARVLYPQQTPWFKPNAVFLSGYSQSERRKLIDAMFNGFRNKFGYFPKSVGAWWIDSYSLQYLRQKYGISTAMIVADQLSTDNYGVWGQWWSVAYYPAKTNILDPASSAENKQPVSIIQWAQRDPSRSYGDTKSFSNYSIQANDYSSQGFNTDYFKEITSVYLDCNHPIGQITVGLETGQESVPYLAEYNRQLDYLQSIPSLNVVNMSDFAQKYAQVYPSFPKNESVNYLQSNWNLTTSSRNNSELNDTIFYNQNLAFSDYFVPDHQGFLDRKLPLQNKESWYFPWWILVAFWGIFYFKKIKIPRVGVLGIIFAVCSYGLLLNSFEQFGWKVYFGPVVDFLPVIQIVAILVGFVVAWCWWKLISGFKLQGMGFAVFLPVLVFGLDPILQFARYTKLDGQTFIGFLTDPFYFIGICFGKNFQFVNQDFSAQVAGALLKLDFQRIWSNFWIWALVYPIIHLLLAIILLFLLLKLPKKIQLGVYGILTVLLLIFLFNMLSADPISVKPITQAGVFSLLQ